jgi:electron transport complex protein RnfG
MVLVLFTITAISAALVALVNDVTKETIAETEQMNRDKAKLEVLPAFEGEPTLKEQNYQLGDFVVNVTEVSAGGEVVGYAVEAPSITKNGYADRIYLMVGFVEETDGVRINGVKVLSQKETPGLGANMTKPGNKLENSILGKKADELVFEVKKDNPNGSFDALSGSTISSRAYANAVETAYAGYLMYKGLLLPEKAEAVKGPEVAVSGAIATEEYISTETETSEGVDAVVDLPADESVEPTVEQTEESVVEGEAVANEQDNDENMESINETIAEPEAQKGDVNE